MRLYISEGGLDYIGMNVWCIAVSGKQTHSKNNPHTSDDINSCNHGDLRHPVDCMNDTSTFLVHKSISFDPFGPERMVYTLLQSM